MAFFSRHAFTSAPWIGLFALALIASVSTSTSAAAAPPAGKIDPKVAARSQADRGYELFEAGSYVEAAQAFRLAEGMFHAPTLVFAIGRAESKAGHLLEARALFQRVIAEKIAAGAPPEYLGAQESARGELTAIEARIARLTITVRGAEGRAIVVRLDDAVVARAALEQPIEIDPGPHHVAVAADAGPAVTREVTAADGAREDVVIDLAPPAKLGGGGPVAPVGAPMRRDLLVPAVISLGLGAAGIGVGAALGAITLSKTSAIRAHCAGDVCPRDQQSAADGARTTATISTAAFITGGVLAATGVTLLVLRPRAAKPAIGLSVGPGSVLAQGAF
ncbi:MAG: hypothetical protein ABJE95_02870 [Byssovorax sp.]